jgi:integrase
LPDFAVDALRTHHERQEEFKQKAGEFWQEHDYVFCTPLGTHIHPGHDILEEFKKLLERAGLPDIRFHDLRHSAATMLLGMGVHPKIVQELLGHNRIQETVDTHSQVLPTIHKEAIRKLEDVLWK